MKLIILSGRSGAGKSVALRVLEDLGCYCVDNLPAAMLPALVTQMLGHCDTLAVSLDIRNLQDQAEQVPEILQTLPESIERQIYFLDASDSSLIKRYSETRRLHPLSRSGASLAEAIASETQLLAPIRTLADHSFMTDGLSVHQLADEIRTRLLGRTQCELLLVFESFGFKHGIPKDADFVFDVRFLPNPHWDPQLRPLTGLDQSVRRYFAKEAEVARFIDHTESFLLNWLPMLERNNRAYLTVAIGCTGGQHRSVYIAQQLEQRFRQRQKQTSVRHRELDNREADQNA
ncbi:RNase adapter RapZ [Ferrimonas sediminicola]|uniref:RNase adapter RapZ n=1 Tax=Ferrimonas sediminicola TaxID=2569538 RepID=A0A4V5NVN5_9GAMM|nr:RNase adapter RapZ [Ferrimonas sediminicola]TKB51231.1 RNase adapter RapZ [Ferrimonas sediminicola]